MSPNCDIAPCIFLYFGRLHPFLSFLLSLLLFAFSCVCWCCAHFSGTNSCCLEFHASQPIPMSQWLWICQPSGFSTLCGYAWKLRHGTTHDSSSITCATFLDVWVIRWLHSRSRIWLSRTVLALNSMCRSFAGLRKLSVNVCCEISSDGSLDVTFWKHFFPLTWFCRPFHLFYLIGRLEYWQHEERPLIVCWHDKETLSIPFAFRLEHYVMVPSWWCAFEGRHLLLVATTPVLSYHFNDILGVHARLQFIWSVYM